MRRKIVAGTVVATALLALVGHLPTTTRILVDYQPQSYTLPLYAKAMEFVSRDVEMRGVAERVAGAIPDSEGRASALLDWTHEHVRPVPAGFPVVDDHPYNIVVRGYGTYDQAADVFANLCAYVGIPGGLVFSRDERGGALYAFAVEQIGGAPRVFDVREGRALRDRDGRLASLDGLRSDPALLPDLPPPAEAHGVSYSRLLARLDSGPHRDPYDQMLLSRPLNALRKLFLPR